MSSPVPDLEGALYIRLHSVILSFNKRIYIKCVIMYKYAIIGSDIMKVLPHEMPIWRSCFEVYIKKQNVSLTMHSHPVSSSAIY